MALALGESPDITDSGSVENFLRETSPDGDLLRHATIVAEQSRLTHAKHTGLSTKSIISTIPQSSPHLLNKFQQHGGRTLLLFETGLRRASRPVF